MKKLFIILICGTVIILSVIGVISWLSWQPQSWYLQQGSITPEVSNLAERGEYRLNEEFHKIRPQEELWKIRITDEIMNAWLTTRLEGWLTHDREIELPQEIHNPQIHTTLEGVWLAAMVEIEEGALRPLAIQLRIWVERGNLQTEPTAIRIGRIPIPIYFLDKAITELNNKTSDMEAMVPLMDEREVEIHSIDFEDGAIVLTCQTHLPE